MHLILLTFLPQIPLQFAQKCTAVHYSWPQNGHSDFEDIKQALPIPGSF
jgi:hypothetical protein